MVVSLWSLCMMRRHSVPALVFLSGAASASAQVLHDNGGLITTPTPACIPVGNSASQLQTVGGVPNGLLGIGCQVFGSTSNRAADDFIVTHPDGWTITSVEFHFYQTLWPTATSPITSINIRIWNAPPGSPGAVVVWGDNTTNRLSASTFSNIYRIPAACSTNRLLFRSTAQINTTLGPGTYWIDFQASGDVTYTGPWTPTVTITGLRGKPGANALQYISDDGVWSAVVDAGPAPQTSPPVAQDFPFVLNGFVPCYANCDGSAVVPVLTANDFQCFLNTYAAGSTAANCDGSTVNPVLTANDFQCFLNKYAAGCP
jgi:hypothetical protein